jgi:hypothetical protein
MKWRAQRKQSLKKSWELKYIPSIFEIRSIACGFKIGVVLYKNLFGYL